MNGRPPNGHGTGNGGLSIIIQRSAAHSVMIPMFVQILRDIGTQCHVLHPADNPGFSWEPAIRDHAPEVSFLRSQQELLGLIDAAEKHASLVFNSAPEINQPWFGPVLSRWRGQVVVFHCTMDEYDRDDCTQLYAHPFRDRERYLLPISSMLEREPGREPPGPEVTIVLPNWSREGQLRHKHLAALDEWVAQCDPDRFRFILCGKSPEIIRAALGRLRYPERVSVRTGLTNAEYADLLQRPNVYILPLIHPQGRYARAGLTGSILLAYKYACPIIIDAAIARAYGIQSFVDETELHELPAQTSLYGRRVHDLLADRDRIMARNLERFRSCVPT